MGKFCVRRYRWAAAIVLAFTAFNMFVGLGNSALNNSDESRYGVAAWEMLSRGSFLVTTYAHRPEFWNLKPPLGYYPMALSFRLFGPTPFALRFPSACFAVGAVAMTMALGKRWFGRRQSLLAGLILATAFGFLSNHGARSGDLDAALTLWATIALASIDRLGKARWRVAVLGLLFGIGFLLKSFAILPLAVIAAIELARTGGWRRQRWVPVATGLALFVLPVVGWASLRSRVDGSPEFVRRMVDEDLFARTTAVIDHVTYSPLGYVGALFDRFAPWPVFLLLALAISRPLFARRFAGRAAAPLVLAWAVVPLLLFSLARTQHHWYLDPSYPAWAMLGAGAVFALVRRADFRWRRWAQLGWIAIPILACEVRFLDRALLVDPVPSSQRFLMSLAGLRPQLGPRLLTGPLRHCDRFILEAMDGFEIEETGDPGTSPASTSERPPRGIVIAKRLGLQPSVPSGARIVRESDDYIVLVAPQHRARPGWRHKTLQASRGEAVAHPRAGGASSG